MCAQAGCAIEERYLNWDAAEDRGQIILERFPTAPGLLILLQSETETRRWSRDYRSRVIAGDLQVQENVQDVGTLERMVLRLPDLVGSPLSLNALRYLKARFPKVAAVQLYQGEGPDRIDRDGIRMICIHQNRNRNRDRNRMARIHRIRNPACMQLLLPRNFEASGNHSALRLHMSMLFDFDFDSDFDSDFELDGYNNVCLSPFIWSKI